MNYYTPEYVTELLINKDDLLSYARRESNDDHMSVYLDAVDDLKVILAAFAKLPEKHQFRINVYLFSGLTQVEMANVLKTRQPNVKRNFLRSIEKLLDLINVES